MDKKWVLIISAAVIIILIAGTILFFAFKPKNYFKEGYDKCIALNQQRYDAAMARRTGDATFCDKLPAEEKKGCIAYIRKDTTFCNDYPEEQKQACQAEISKNPALCPINDYWCLAYAAGNEKHCQQLEDEASKKECITYVRNDAESFISAEAEQTCRDSAYSNAAIQAKDKVTCNKIIDPELKKQCLAAF